MSLRLERFELRAFGPFTRTALELRDAPAGALHIICGPNEIGKSTAQRGIGDFLFGIPPRSTDNQLHDYVDMRLAAVLVDEHGHRHEFVRRKGARSTLLGPDDEPVDEGLLEGMLGGMTREVFESMFSITHESLVVGGNALLAADGDLGESLFSASLGAASLHELRAELDRQASELFRPRANSSLILVARSALEAAQARQRETTLRATAFTEHERLLKGAGVEREQLAEEIRDARARQRTRARLRTVIPLLAAHRQVCQELSQLTDAPDLPNDVSERRVRAVERAAGERSAAQDARARVADLTERIRRLTDDPALLDSEMAIKDINGRLANVRESASDLERQTVKLQTAKGLAERALNQIQPGVQLDDAEQLVMTAAQRAKLDRALEQYAKLTALLHESESDCSDAEDRAHGVAEELDALDAPQEAAALASAVSEALADGRVEQRIVDAQEEFDRANELLDAASRDLIPALDAEALRTMRPARAATVEQFAAEREALDDRARKLNERRERLNDEQRSLNDEHAKLALSTNAPSVEDLGAARAQRDQHWQQLRRHLEGGEDERTSPDTFEGQLRHADDLSDRLRAEADSVARRAQLTVRERRLKSESEDLDEQDRALGADRRDHEARWAQLWSEIEIKPGSPREMTDWLRVRRAVLERADAVTRRARELENEQHTCERHLGALRTEMTAVGCNPPSSATLPRLLTMAQVWLDDAQKARERHAELIRELRSARMTAGRQREKADDHRQALTNWKNDWTQAIALHRWPEDIGPDSARQVLTAIEELGTQLHEMEQLGARVAGIEERLSAFASDAEQIIQDVAPEFDSWPAPDAIAEMGRRLEDAIQIRSRRQTLEEELDAASQELKTSERAVEQVDRDLKGLVEMAGVATTEEMPEAERRSQRAADLRAQLPELERQIAEAGQAPLSELLERAHDIDIDALDAQLAEAEDALVQQDERLQALDVRLGQLGSEQQKMERTGGAANAAEVLQQQFAELRELTARYMHFYVAAWALSEAIDAYRREHKAPLLKRADELFPRLTCGRFQGLEVSFDDADEPVLVGIRHGGEKVPVKLMSTGTREQLYLALRLASLERHVQLHGPMTVILDDVVLHSDPKSKSAILDALADLGRRTQVIAFSHDPQVVALAQNAIDPDLLTVHELGGTEITGALQPLITAADVRPIRPAKAA